MFPFVFQGPVSASIHVFSKFYGLSIDAKARFDATILVTGPTQSAELSVIVVCFVVCCGPGQRHINTFNAERELSNRSNHAFCLKCQEWMYVGCLTFVK